MLEISGAMSEETYYEKNRDTRKSYQKQYYRNNKDKIRRKRMLEEIEDPKKFEARKAYQRNYYQQNKEKILKKRAELYAKRKAAAKS